MSRNPVDFLANMPEELMPGLAPIERAIVTAIKRLKDNERKRQQGGGGNVC